MSNLSVFLKGKIGSLFLNFEHYFKNNGITILYGPNGSGKSTIISALGGFINSIETIITFNGNELHHIDKYPPYKRPFGIMFQNPILFENLTVEENLDFVIKRNLTKSQNKILISKEYLIKHLELHSLLKSSPENLSGGEKLRVVLARTILKQPMYLLLDEPMSDLDIKYKAKLLIFLKDLNKKFKIPILYITHSIEEISQIGDKIVLIKDGKKIDDGSVSDILNTNSFRDLTGKFELSSVLDGIVVSHDHNLHITTLDLDGQKLIVPGLPGNFNNVVRVRIRSRDILLASSRLETKITENELEGLISTIEIENNSAFSELVILLKNLKNNKNIQKLRARITTYNLKKMKLSKNDTVFIYISSVSIDRQAYQSI
jgi:molybdate transport system ATP-binding protein